MLVALTWGGVRFRWDSAHVLAPLIIGFVGIIAFFVLERTWIKGKTVRHDFFHRDPISCKP